jgi:hypothetical protein
MLYSDSSEDEQLLIRPLLSNKKEKYEYGDRFKHKLKFCVMETTHEPLHLNKVW